MRVLVTGCAGFIGSNFVDYLLAKNNDVIGIDNLSTGQPNFLDNAINNDRFIFVNKDLLDIKEYIHHFKNIELVIHLAANADVREGIKFPRRDLEQNTIVTSNVLECMRINKLNKIIFSSTGSIYGEAEQIPTLEDNFFPIQTSMYGASKLACEGLIQAYCEAYEIKSWIYRFVSILGPRYTHGHVFDFYKQLSSDPSKLNILGDGKQKKSYLHVNDCIEGVFYGFKHSAENVNIFNLGVNDYCEVNDSVRWICEELNLKPSLTYSGGNKGWIGDNPFIYLDTKKINNLGWSPIYSIKEGIQDTVRFMLNNEWIFKERT